MSIRARMVIINMRKSIRARMSMSKRAVMVIMTMRIITMTVSVAMRVSLSMRVVVIANVRINMVSMRAHIPILSTIVTLQPIMITRLGESMRIKRICVGKSLLSERLRMSTITRTHRAHKTLFRKQAD